MFLQSGFNVQNVNNLPNGVTPGTYNYITIDESGLATNGAITTITGTTPITATTNTSGNTTIALAASGVTAGTYNSVMVDTQGIVTAGSNTTPTSVNATFYSYLDAGSTTLAPATAFQLIGMATTASSTTGMAGVYSTTSQRTPGTGYVTFNYAGTYVVVITVQYVAGTTGYPALITATMGGSTSNVYKKAGFSYADSGLDPLSMDLTFYCTVAVGDTLTATFSNVSSSSGNWTLYGGPSSPFLTYAQITRLS